MRALHHRAATVLLSLAAFGAGGCLPATAPASPPGEERPPPAPGRTLAIAISREPASVADKTLRRTGSGIGPDK